MVIQFWGNLLPAHLSQLELNLALAPLSTTNAQLGAIVLIACIGSHFLLNSPCFFSHHATIAGLLHIVDRCGSTYSVRSSQKLKPSSLTLLLASFGINGKGYVEARRRTK